MHRGVYSTCQDYCSFNYTGGKQDVIDVKCRFSPQTSLLLSSIGNEWTASVLLTVTCSLQHRSVVGPNETHTHTQKVYQTQSGPQQLNLFDICKNLK